MNNARRPASAGRRLREPRVNALLARVGRGLVVSASTTLLSAVILVALAVGARVPAATANIVAVVCGIGPSYVGNRRFVWRRESPGSVAQEVVPFWMLSLAGLLVSTISVARVASWSQDYSASVRAIALPAANLAVFGALWIVQFLVCDRVIFRSTHGSTGSHSAGGAADAASVVVNDAVATS